MTDPTRTRRTIRRFAIAIAFGIVASIAPAMAAPDDRKIVVMEAHVGERSKDDARLMEQLRDQLETQGFAAKPETIARLAGARAPRPGVVDAGITLAEIKRRVDVGYDAYMSAKFDLAVTSLANVRLVMRRNPGLLVSDTEHANLVVRAYVGLALSLAKLGKSSEGVEVMTELIRMYRSQPISPADYGPKAEEFYRTVSKQVLASGRGTLSISASHPQAIIFVDGQFRGTGIASLGDLLPGAYHVFVQVPNTVGRRYEVEVRANLTSKLEVSEADSALWLGEAWVGFQFASDAERGKEATLAGQLVRRWGAGDLVAVIGTVKLQGKPAVIGTLYRTDGKVMRSAIASLDGTGEVNLRSLARFLADGTPSAGLEIVKKGTTPPLAATAPRGWDPLPLAAVGLGLGAGGLFGLGISVYVDRVDDNPNARLGYAVAGVGIALGVVSTIIYFRTRKSKGGSGIAIVPTENGMSASVGWSF